MAFTDIIKRHKVITIVTVLVILVIIIVIVVLATSSATDVASSSSASSSATDVASTSSGLIVYYPFDTDVKDKSGNGKDATMFGSPTFVVGTAIDAINLNGKSQYVQLPSGILSSITNQFTISFWVYPNSLDSWARLFDFGYGNTTKYIFMTSKSGLSGTLELAYAVKGGDDVRLQSPKPLSTGIWQHIVVVYNNGTVTQYVNGVSAGQMTLTTPFLYSDATTNYIGKSQFASDPYLNAIVDEFKIYNVAKNPTTV